jgi:hypothetical protein
MWTGVLLLSLVAAAPSAGASTRSQLAVECDTWQACQAAVETALAAESFDRAHDLAWRAVQRGPQDDPALMFLLARAQSRVGRPQDALVMVRRLAERGVATAAATHPDLARMRQLDGWPAVDAMVARANAGAPAVPAVTPSVVALAMPAPPVETATSARGAVVMEAARLTEESLRFSTDRFVPAGLAYDAVSRRFVMGDQLGRKLRIVGEGLHHAVDLVRAESAGFLDIRALAIDPRRGDLWVATSDPDGASGTLHRIQLISGRPLQSLPLAGDAGRPVRPVDLAIADAGSVFMLDRDGRVWRARAGGTVLETVADVAAVAPALSLALAAHDTVAYVSHADGLTRVDLAKGRSTVVRTVAEVPLTSIERLRAHRDGFVALRRGSDGEPHLLRLELSRDGLAVRRATTYDVRVEAGDSAAAMTVSGDEVSLVAGGSHTPGEAGASPSAIGPPAELVVRRFRLR